MHYLHKILVHMPSAEIEYKDTDRDELVYNVRSYAEDETESYYEKAFDWRETSTAGRWSDEYPENVLFAAEDIERFIDELKDCVSSQKREVYTGLSRIKDTVGTDLNRIVDGLLSMDSYNDSKDGFNHMTSYYLLDVSSKLYGVYECDSFFYNTCDYTSRIYSSDFDRIRENPDEWALAMFDYHN